MSNDHEFIERTRRWAERPIDPAFQPCEGGPLFATLLDSVRLGLPLDPADQTHVAECPRCRRTFEFLQRLSDEDSDAGDISTSPVIGHGRDPRRALQRLRASHRVRWLAGLATAAAVGMALLWMFVNSGSHRAEASCFLCEVGFAAPLVGALAGPAGPMPADAEEWNARIEKYRADRDALVAAGDAAIAAAEAAWAAGDAALRAGQIDRAAGEFALARIHLGAATDQAEWQPWVQIYRNLFAAGRFAEATAELDAFVEFGRQRDQTLPDRYSMYASALFEKGERCAAHGDMEAAWKWHLESLAVRRDFNEWALNQPGQPVLRPHRRESAKAATLYPSLAALSMLAAAEGDLPLAWDYNRQAEQKLAPFFVAESRYQGVPVPRRGTLVDLSQGVVSNADHGSVSLIVKVREHLFRTARLHRMGRDLDAAERALDDSRRIGEALDEHRRTVNEVVRAQAGGGPVPSDRLVPDPEGADESRLDFNEPLERLRIAIAREDFAAAVAFAKEAARHTGGRTFAAPDAGPRTFAAPDAGPRTFAAPDTVPPALATPPSNPSGTPLPHPPIGVLARAELDFLHGVALAGLHPQDPDDPDAPLDPAALRREALRLIDSALDTIDEIAASLPATDRKRFLDPFQTWRTIAARTAEDMKASGRGEGVPGTSRGNGFASRGTQPSTTSPPTIGRRETANEPLLYEGRRQPSKSSRLSELELRCSAPFDAHCAGNAGSPPGPPSKGKAMITLPFLLLAMLPGSDRDAAQQFAGSAIRRPEPPDVAANAAIRQKPTLPAELRIELSDALQQGDPGPLKVTLVTLAPLASGEVSLALPEGLAVEGQDAVLWRGDLDAATELEFAYDLLALPEGRHTFRARYSFARRTGAPAAVTSSLYVIVADGDIRSSPISFRQIERLRMLERLAALGFAHLTLEQIRERDPELARHIEELNRVDSITVPPHGDGNSSLPDAPAVQPSARGESDSQTQPPDKEPRPAPNEDPQFPLEEDLPSAAPRIATDAPSSNPAYASMPDRLVVTLQITDQEQVQLACSLGVKNARLGQVVARIPADDADFLRQLEQDGIRFSAVPELDAEADYPPGDHVTSLESFPGPTIYAGMPSSPQNEKKAPAPLPAELPGWETIFTDGFEGSWYWNASGYPTWRDTNYRSYSGSWSAWCAKNGLTPPGPYAPNMNAWMVYGPFDLSDATDAQVRFAFWLDSEPGFDYFKWYASGDGTNWAGFQRSSRDRAWQTRTFSLADHLGDNTVWFAFKFDSDSSVQYEGAYVDAVVIEKLTQDCTYSIYDARVRNLIDQDGDGCSRQLDLEWDADTSCTSADVYAKVYARPPSGGDSWVGTSACYRIYGNQVDWKAMPLFGNSACLDWDFRIDLYTCGDDLLRARLAYGQDPDLIDISIERASDDNPTVTISGYARLPSGQGLSSVLMSFTGQGTTTTNSSGYYAKILPYGWTGTATPSRATYLFNPASRSYSNLTSDRTSEDYTARPARIRVQGQMRAEDRFAGDHPIRYAKVTVWDDDPVFDDLLGETATDSGGYYSIEVDNNENDGEDIYVRVHTEAVPGKYPNTTSGICHVTDNVFHLPFYMESPVHTNWEQEVLHVYLNASYCDGDLCGGFAVYESIVEGFHKVYVIFGSELDEITAWWPDDSTEYQGGAIHLVKEDRWDRDVIMHEYGHYIADVYNFAQGDVGTNPYHTWNENLCCWPQGVNRTDEQARNLAFREAWATLFSISAQYGDTQYPFSGDTIYHDVEGQGIMDWDLEKDTDDHDFPGEFYENMNTCSLWDVFDDLDDPVDDRDAIDDGALIKTWTIMYNSRPDDIIDLWNGWFTRYGQAVDLTRLFLDHRMRFIAQYPTGPAPADGARDQSVTVDLNWADAQNAVSYDVYFGTNPTPGGSEYKGNTRASEWSLPDLDYNTTYYWQVVSRDQYARAQGPVWSFRTETCAPQTPQNATADPSVICRGEASILRASVEGAVIDWYANGCGEGGRVCSGTNSCTVHPDATTRYYARSRIPGYDCESPGCDDVVVTVVVTCDDGNACTTDRCSGGECQHATVDCDDGVGCTVDSCDQQRGCEHRPDDGQCSDGQYCNGAEFCDVQSGCIAGDDPCDPPLYCREGDDACVECLVDAHCDDGNACTTDRCTGGECQHATVDCDDGVGCTVDSCDQQRGCEHRPDDGQCNDDQYCNGAEFCDIQSGCIAGDDPCDPPLYCREGDDACVECLEDGHCDDGDPCTGFEYCDTEGACHPGAIRDCNDNGIEDSCDIDRGGSEDCQGNRVPDECEWPSAQRLLVSSRDSDSVIAFGGWAGEHLWDFASPGEYGLDYPNGIAQDDRGRVYIASVNTNDYGSILVFSGATRTVVAEMSSSHLIGPVDLLFLPPSTLLVSSWANDTVVAFDTETGQGRICVAGGSGGLDGPAGMLRLGTGNLLVASQSGNAVLEYDGQDCTFVRVLASGCGLNGPGDLLLTPDGKLLVSNFRGDSVLLFSSAGECLGECVPRGDGGLAGPFGMDWGPDGHLYVSSQGTDRVLEYRYDVETQSCPFVGVFAVGGGVDSPTYIAFADLGNDCNRNGSPDDCDIADGRERDRDGNGMPDACEPCVRNPEWICDGDVDGNGAVNPVDVGLVQAAFGSTDGRDLCQYDLDCNGAINPVDSGIVQLLYGSCDPPRDVCQ